MSSISLSSRTLASALLAMALLLFAIPSARAEDTKQEEAKQEAVGLPHCPVHSDHTVNFRIYSDTADGRVFFCCEGCKGAFDKEPEKYSEGVNKQREELGKLEKVQIKCPVTGKPIDPGVWFEYKGEKLAFYDGFACGDFLKDDQPYISNLKDCYTYQSKCPVSGKPINVFKHFTTEDGLTVYFCCGNCCAAFAKDPGKYADALKEMGYPIDVPTKQGGDAEKPAADEKPEAKEAPKDQVAKFEGLPPCAVNPGSKVDFTKFFLTEDGPVYFCCGNCCAEFAKDPAKYAEGVKKQREHLATLDKIQVSCPVSGKPVDPNVTKEFDGQTIAFCCTNCCAEYSKDPAKFAKELVGSFTYQTLCPVSDKPIDPSVSFELAAGQKVYFCCGNCCAEFAKDPAKYADKVKEQGYKFDFEAKKEVAKAEAPAPEEKVAKFEGLPPCAVNPGSKVDFTKFFLTEDGPVYFCCGNCCAEFAKDPAKYAEGVEKQRAHLASLTKIQVACPVSGKPVDPNVTKEFDGQTIAFCCTNCCAEYSKDPAKFAKELVGSFTYQTLCPVSGKPIDPTVSFELAAGQRVYFCCGNCCAEFAKDPAKYADKVKEQGYKFDFEAKTKAAKAEEPKSEEKPAEQAKAESEESVELPNCVVNSGGKINLAKFVLTDEGPVYFCCDGCKAKYEADPGKFADSVAEQHKLIAALPKSQVCCPLSGKPCDTQFTAEYDGQKVAFCCGNCCAAFSKDPAAYADKLASAFTLQTVCPVSGKPINPQASLEVSDGVQLYFCCQGCKTEYEKNPEKYKDSLAKQGFQF